MLLKAVQAEYELKSLQLQSSLLEMSIVSWDVNLARYGIDHPSTTILYV